MGDEYYVEVWIRPCPFCGGASSPERSWQKSWVECDTCGSRGKAFYRDDWRKAIEFWNNVRVVK